MLKNDYLVAKIGFDTDENEPSKVCSFSLKNTGLYSSNLSTEGGPASWGMSGTGGKKNGARASAAASGTGGVSAPRSGERLRADFSEF